jgi:hypothetical protein
MGRDPSSRKRGIFGARGARTDRGMGLARCPARRASMRWRSPARRGARPRPTGEALGRDLPASRPAYTAVDALAVAALNAVAVPGVRRLAAVAIGWRHRARRGARPRPAGEPPGPAPRLMPWPRRGAQCRRGARRAAPGRDRRPAVAPPAGQGPRPRSAREPAGPAPRSTPGPRRGARCRPRAAPVVRCVNPRFRPRPASDCRKCRGGSRANLRQMPPSKRPCRAPACISAMGQVRTHAPQKQQSRGGTRIRRWILHEHFEKFYIIGLMRAARHCLPRAPIAVPPFRALAGATANRASFRSLAGCHRGGSVVAQLSC